MRKVADKLFERAMWKAVKYNVGQSGQIHNRTFMTLITDWAEENNLAKIIRRFVGRDEKYF